MGIEAVFDAAEIILFLYALESVGVFLLLLYGNKKTRYNNNKTISILIAARNEEDNIEECLNSIFNLNYPLHLIEVWIGDDGSEDSTAIKIKDFIQDKPNFYYFYVSENLPGLLGKQNVLAQLAQKATGDFLLFTDADITHHRDWAQTMVGAFDSPEVGVVSAPTVVFGKGLLAKMQSLDWILGVSVIRAFAVLGLPVTAIGNNMAVRTSAYRAVGAYENISFSITEDYKLWAEILKKGYKWRWLFQPEAMNESKPIKGLFSLIRQRKRWFKGGSEGPWYAIFTFLLHALSAPASLFLLFSKWNILFISLKLSADALHLIGGAIRLKRYEPLAYLPFYWLYLNLSHLILPFYFLIPQKINWKGRIY